MQILTGCQSALAPGGRVLLVEFVIPEGTASSGMTRLDTTMLVFTDSRERTKLEYSVLLQRAGLRLLRTLSTASPFSILEATAA